MPGGAAWCPLLNAALSDAANAAGLFIQVRGAAALAASALTEPPVIIPPVLLSLGAKSAPAVPAASRGSASAPLGTADSGRSKAACHIRNRTAGSEMLVPRSGPDAEEERLQVLAKVFTTGNASAAARSITKFMTSHLDRALAYTGKWMYDCWLRQDELDASGQPRGGAVQEAKKGKLPYCYVAGCVSPWGAHGQWPSVAQISVNPYDRPVVVMVRGCLNKTHLVILKERSQGRAAPLGWELSGKELTDNVRILGREGNLLLAIPLWSMCFPGRDPSEQSNIAIAYKSPQRWVNHHK